MPRAWAALLVLALLAGTWWHGRRTGAAQVQAEWTADTLQRERLVQLAEAQQRRRSHAAGVGYEAQRAANTQRLATARPELRQALQQPACPPGAPNAPTLADLPIPAAAVDRLRHAAGPAVEP
jgi:hypothetical protein